MKIQRLPILLLALAATLPAHAETCNPNDDKVTIELTAAGGQGNPGPAAYGILYGTYPHPNGASHGIPNDRCFAGPGTIEINTGFGPGLPAYGPVDSSGNPQTCTITTAICSGTYPNVSCSGDATHTLYLNTATYDVKVLKMPGSVPQPGALFFARDLNKAPLGQATPGSHITLANGHKVIDNAQVYGSCWDSPKTGNFEFWIPQNSKKASKVTKSNQSGQTQEVTLRYYTGRPPKGPERKCQQGEPGCESGPGPGPGPGGGQGGLPNAGGGPPDCGEEPPDSEGQPVDLIDGNMWLVHTDVVILGRPGIALRRRYDSLLSGTVGSFGSGFNSTYEVKITAQPEYLLRTESTGRESYFIDPDADQMFTSPPGVRDTSYIVKAVDGSYTHHFAGGAYETFNASGRFLSRVTSTGHTVSLSYDANGRLERVTDSSGRFLAFERNGSGRVVRALSPDGVAALYAYDSSSHLTSVSYPDGGGYTYSYNSAGLLDTVRDMTGRILETHAYLADGRAQTSELEHGRGKYTLSYGEESTTVTDANGHTSLYEFTWIQGIPHIFRATGSCSGCGGGQTVREWDYDEEGRIIEYRDGAGRRTTFGYDTLGNLTARTQILNAGTSYTATYGYDSLRRLTSVTYPDGGQQTFTYGARGVTNATQKLTSTQNRSVSVTYNTAGYTETVTDPRGKVTTLGYNATGDVTSINDPLSHATTVGRDAMGRPTTITDPLSHALTLSYDPRGRIKRITRHDGTYSEVGYDLTGRRTSVRDPKGQMTYFYYDLYGRLERVVDLMGGSTLYAYDLMSNLTSLTDAKGQATQFAYDSQDRLQAMTHPGGGSDTLTYNGAGQVETRTDRRGIVTTYSYDGVGRLTGKSYSNGDPAVSYTYDSTGRLLTANTSVDTLTFAYDLAGQLVSEASSRNSSLIETAYDLGGNRVSLSQDGQVFLNDGYDDAGRLTSITRGSSVIGFGYDNANRGTSLAYPNGITTSYTYDALNQLTRLKADLGATPITDFQYLYDAAGNRTRKQQLDYAEDYAYDGLYRLTGVDRTGTGAKQALWTYDVVGNRLTEADSTPLAVSSSYDANNRLLTRTGGGLVRWRGSLSEPGAVSFASATVNGQPARMLAGNVFEADLPMATGSNTVTVQATDVNANTTTKQYQVTVSGTGATFSYDLAGNLVTKVEGPDTWAYEWNAENQLKRVTKNDVEQASFLYDPLGRRVLKVGSVTTTYTYDGIDILREIRGGATLRYVHGPGIDEPLAREQSGALTFLHADGLGSIVKETDAAGAVTLARHYDAWGNLEAGGSTPGYAFTGRELDPEIGLYYYRARYYDPKLGRFLSEDPIGFEGGNNFYPYVENNPVNLVDPFGLQACIIIGRVPPIFRPHTFRPFPNQTFNPAGRAPRATPPRPYVPVQQPLPPPPGPTPPPWWMRALEELMRFFDPTPPAVLPPCGQCPSQPPDCPPGMVCIA